jgi:hypothetical protein
LGHQGEEVRPILLAYLAGINQPQIGFLHERGGLQRVACAFATIPTENLISI